MARPHRLSSGGVRRALVGKQRMDGYDIFHGLDIDIPFRRSAPTVTTVHDLSVFDVPESQTRHRATAERRLVAHAIKKADAIIAVSEFTAGRVAERFGREATVTTLAPRSDLSEPTEDQLAQVQRKYRLPDRFVLHVGTIEPRKSLASLARSCHCLNVPLVLAGSRRIDVEWPGVVHELGYVPATDLAPLYRLATVVAYPSHYEGFALPPVEAISCGATVLATAVGALPELIGSVMPLPPPSTPDRYHEALAGLLDDPTARAEIAGRARAVVDQLSWDRTAQATLDVYRSLGCSV